MYTTMAGCIARWAGVLSGLGLLLAVGAGPGPLVVSCSNASDCTAELQAALDDRAVSHVIVPGRAEVYATRPLFVVNRSDFILELGAAAVLQARRKFFRGRNDALVRSRAWQAL